MAIANPTVPPSRIPDVSPLQPSGSDLEQHADGRMSPIHSPVKFTENGDFNQEIQAAGYHQASVLGSFEECEVWEASDNSLPYHWVLGITPFASRFVLVWCRNLPELLAGLKHVRDLVATSRLNADFYRIETEVHQDKVLEEADRLGIKRW
jgi:hypothetical protein